MSQRLERRELLKLLGVGGVVYASGLSGCASAGGAAAPAVAKTTPKPRDDFFFMQISDTHWGFSGAAVNPHADVELKTAVATINSASAKPDFVVFTGDLTHNTDDPAQRRQRMGEFKRIVSELAVPVVRFMPGEHDAAADSGEAYREFFGDLHYTFDHKGIHFIALDNVSDPHAQLGEAQLAWLKQDLSAMQPDSPIVVLAHRPLWDLKPEWDWTTSDGAQAIAALMPYRNVSVFFGHIHQELHHQTGHIGHHAARSLMFPLPPPETPGKRAPVPWDADHPEQGLGYRSIQTTPQPGMYSLRELPLAAARVVAIKARRWSFEPETIALKKGEPVTLELSSSDVHHGFNAPGLGLHAEVLPGQVARLQITPEREGVFPFHCDFYCGEGHEGMEGTIVVG